MALKLFILIFCAMPAVLEPGLTCGYSKRPDIRLACLPSMLGCVIAAISAWKYETLVPWPPLLLLYFLLGASSWVLCIIVMYRTRHDYTEGDIPRSTP